MFKRISPKLAGLVLALTATALPALAQTLPNMREARRLVFARDGAVVGEVIPNDSLSTADVAILNQIVATQKYYAAVAISPDQGLVSEATVAAANFHDEDNARRVALEGCNERRAEDSAECAIVLIIRPEGWEPGRPLQLNTDATAALWGSYRQLGRPRAMAISEAAGQWGVGDSWEAAVSDCGQPDCRVVVDN